MSPGSAISALCRLKPLHRFREVALQAMAVDPVERRVRACCDVLVDGVFAPSDFHVAVAPAPEADLLGLYPKTRGALSMQSTVYDREGRPTEYLVSWNHPDRVAFESLREDTGRPQSVLTDWSSPKS